MRDEFVILAAAIAAGACAKSDSSATDSSKAPAPAAATATPAAASKVGETSGLQTPESVRYDAELDIFYVSNINGNPSQHDNNGFIAVIRADSTGNAPKVLVQGGKNGVTLDAPKGLALVGDTLWVADINHVRAFNRRTGAPVADIDLSPQKATFLNDVVADASGAIYVTDTGILIDAKGVMSHPGIDQIFKITGRTVVALRPDSLDAPKGIAGNSTSGRFVLGPANNKAIQTWKEGDKATTALVNG